MDWYVLHASPATAILITLSLSQCQDYRCCGRNLADLHALVEHIEESHVVLDPRTPRPLLSTSAPLPLPIISHAPSRYLDSDVVSMAFDQGLQNTHGCADADGTEIDVDPTAYSAPSSRAPSPSEMPMWTPSSGYSTSKSSLEAFPAYFPHPSQHTSPVAAVETTKVLPSNSNAHTHLHHPQPRLAYKRFDPDDMEINVDPTASRTPFSGYPTSTSSLDAFFPAYSLRLSPHISPAAAFGTTKVLPSNSNAHTYLHHPQPRLAYKRFDPDDMEIDVDPTASRTPFSSYSMSTSSLEASCTPYSPHTNQPESPIAALDTSEVLSSFSHYNYHDNLHGASRSPELVAAPEVLKDAYAGSSRSSSPRTWLPMQQSMALPPMNPRNSVGDGGAVCAPPALLLSRNTGNTRDLTSPSSQVASPVQDDSESLWEDAQAPSPSPRSDAASSPSPPNASASGSDTASALMDEALKIQAKTAWSLVSQKFKCPRPNCNKSYRQPNGLKYHLTHGSCTFAPSKGLVRFQKLFAIKHSEKEAVVGGKEAVTLSDAEVKEVQKEVEIQIRPYACGLDGCQRRYTSLNGLRESPRPYLSKMVLINENVLTGYHYARPDKHSAIGRGLLASGRHPSQLRQKPEPERPATRVALSG